MKFTASHYFEAALERMSQSRMAYREGNSYALAMYLAGLSVECLLRAFLARKRVTFDARHNLLLLFKQSGMMTLNEEWSEVVGLRPQTIDGIKYRLNSDLQAIDRLWNNAFRFAGEGRLRSELHSQNLHRGIKGDHLKATAIRLIAAAGAFIERGAIIWNALSKK